MSSELMSFTTKNGNILVYCTPEQFSILTHTLATANKSTQHKRSQPDQKKKSGRPVKPLLEISSPRSIGFYIENADAFSDLPPF